MVKNKGNRSTNLLKDIDDDDRFAKISTNPLFKEMPRKERKIVVDERFKQIFTNDRFKIGNFKMDKRGRKIGLSRSDQLSNLYDQEESDEDKDHDTSEAEIEGEEVSSSSEEDEDEEENELDIRLDLARGEGNVSSSSSSDETESNNEAEEELEDSDQNFALNSWGEMDRSVQRVEWASRRIAICNLEWDRLKAEDLLVVLNSVKPASGVIYSISIYLSDFGAERIEEENLKGPTLPTIKDSGDDEKISNKAIRAYQMEKLKYYYAVCECDSEDTAMTIYESCDGVEYEMSGVRFDIRFIPTDMEFNETRLRERVTSNDINIILYKPKKFESSALSNAEVKLSWDETDPERIKSIRNAFKDDNLKAYEKLIAPASDSDGDDEATKNQIELLLSTKNLDRDSEVNKEELNIGWETPENREVESSDDSNNNHCDINEKKNEKGKKLTPFQEYLERRKQKRKERKAHIQETRQQKKEALEELNESNRKKSVKRRYSSKNDDGTTLDLGDSRFSALFTDSAYAIDPTHSLYKGGELAARQAEAKAAKRSRY